LKTCIKLYGPSIDRAIDALDELIKEMRRGYQLGRRVSHIVSVVDPSIDLLTGRPISGAQLGDYDYCIEWLTHPNPEHIKILARGIDDALWYTGCEYTLTTKE
jgi:hypothetical protein